MARRKTATVGLIGELSVQIKLAKDPNILVFTPLGGLGPVDIITLNMITGEYTAYDVVNNFENLFFDVFMKYGWHLSLREGLYCENHYEPHTKPPFPRANKEMINDIKNIIEKMKIKLNSYE